MSYISADNVWRVDVIELTETSRSTSTTLRSAACGPVREGVSYRVSQHGYHAGDCKTQAEVERLTGIPLDEMRVRK